MPTKTLLNTGAATHFGASAQTSPMVTSDVVRLNVAVDGSEILVWDMTLEQATLLAQRLQDSDPGNYVSYYCANEGCDRYYRPMRRRQGSTHLTCLSCQMQLAQGV